MKGEVLHYDDNAGTGQISGVDGIRYNFTRADLKQLVPISRGSKVDFDFEGKQARDIYLDTVAPASTATTSPPAPPPFTGPVEPERSLWSYFIRAYTTNFARFRGRARRKEYWGVVLFSAIIGVVLAGICIAGLQQAGPITDAASLGRAMDSSPMVLTGVVLLSLYGLLSILPGLGLLVRRLHDIGQSGWIVLVLAIVGVVPYFGIVASIATLVIACLKGQPRENKYGPPPKPV